MGGYADNLQKKAVEVLQLDERLIGAVRTQPRGATMGRAVGGVIGGAEGECAKLEKTGDFVEAFQGVKAGG
jgi:hypothetical protein